MKLFKKGLSLILAIVMLISVVPMTTFANNETKKKLKVDTSVSETDVNELKIDGEILSLRDEFTKVYELEDGTYYEVKSLNPLHTKNGKQWQDVSKIAEPNKVADIEAALKSVPQTNNRTAGSNEAKDITTDFSFWCRHYNYENGYSANSTLLDVEDLMHVGISTYGDNSENVTISAQLTINLSVVNSTEDNVYMFENPNSISDFSTATFNDLYCMENADAHLLDMAYVNETGAYTFDLTDAFNRWSKGYSENNGIVFNTVDLESTVTNVVSTRRYRTVNPFSNTSTYHQVDMGRAGTVYIDDFTNQLYLRTNEISVASNLAPVQVQRLINYPIPSNSSNYYGADTRINYEAMIERVYVDNNQKSMYLWHAVNGQSIYFIAENGPSSVDDTENAGYTLSTQSSSGISGTDFSGFTLTTPENSTITFRSDGRMTNLVDQYGDEIYIKYMVANDKIDYIQDGLNRRYVFEYSSGSSLLNDITVKYRQGVMYKQLTVDGEDVKYSYTYTNAGERYNLLSAITFPNGESVSYTYDTNGYLSTITDIDGRRLTINYSQTVPAYSMSVNNVACNITRTVDTVNRYPAVSGYVEQIPNVDDDPNSANYQAYFTVSSLEIDNHNSYQRKFTDHKGNVSLIKYDHDLRPVFTKNDKGVYASYQYAQDAQQDDTITTFSPSGFENNMVSNPNFDVNTSGWTLSNSTNISRRRVSHPDFSNNYMMRFVGNNTANLFAYTTINASNIATGSVLVLSGKGIANAPVNNENNFFGIEVYSCSNSSGANAQLLYQLPFDTTVYYEQQEAIGAFSLTNQTSYLMVKLVFSKQSGTALFDDIQLALASDGVVTNVANQPTGSSNPSDTTLTYNNKGLLTSKTKTNPATNESKVTTFSYDNKYFLSEYGNNNISTDYVYDSKSGLVTSKAGSYGSTTYESSPLFLLKKVSTAVSGLSSGNSIDTYYTYVADRVKTITNNSQTYSFEYNSFGKVKEIKLKGTNEATVSPLTEYNYKGTSDKLNYIEFANGDRIDYTYNAAGKITEIYADNGLQARDPDYRYYYYDYYYDGSGNLTAVYDEVSEWCIEYSNNSYTITRGDDDEVIYSDVINSGTQEHDYSVFGMDYNQSETKTSDQQNNTVLNTSLDLSFTSSNNDDYEESVSGTSKVDYFGRKTDISFDSETVENPFLDGDEITRYEVKTDFHKSNSGIIDDRITFGKTSITNEQTEIERHFKSTYEYDSDGRISKVFYALSDDSNELDNNLALAYYYEYDEANQVKVCVNVLNNELYTYSYDSSGNIAEKKRYGENDYTFNTSTCTYTLSNASDTNQYTYNVKGLLATYNGHTITTNANGNPEDYYNGNTHYRLVWVGNRLMSAIEMSGDNERYRFDYCYDENGMLIKKTKVDNPGSDNEQEVSKTEYVWNDGKMSGYRYWFKESGNWYSLSGKYIYDGDEAIGVLTHSDVYSSNLITLNDIYDNTEVLTNNIFWFVKDAQGNTVSIYSPRNDFSLDINREANGFPGFGATGCMIDCIDEYCHRQNGRWAGIATALGIAFAMGDVQRFNASDYKGFLYDYDTNLCFADGRYYSPSLGRFLNIGDLRDMTKDIGNSAIANPFAFCNNDTINNCVEKGTVKPFVETQLDVNYVTNWYKYFKQH